MSDASADLHKRLEALLFLADEPLSCEQMSQITESEESDVDSALAALMQRLEEQSGLCLKKVAGGYRLETKGEYLQELKTYMSSQKSSKLSMAALETLALIAYKQPITAVEIADMRMVSSVGSIIKNLLEKKLIKMAGRKQVIGRPMLYRTTKDFLVKFGLDNIRELPSLEEFAKTYAQSEEEEELPEMQSEVSS